MAWEKILSAQTVSSGSVTLSDMDKLGKYAFKEYSESNPTYLITRDTTNSYLYQLSSTGVASLLKTFTGKLFYDACLNNNSLICTDTSKYTYLYDMLNLSADPVEGTTPKYGITYGRIVYFNNKYVLLGSGSSSQASRVAYSTDGSNWTSGSGWLGANVTSALCAGDNAVVGIFPSNIYSSTDGINWSYCTKLNQARQICYNNNEFKSVGPALLYRSSDSTNWTSSSISGSVSTYCGICYIPSSNKYLLLGSDGTIVSSTDLNTYTTIASALATSGIGKLAYKNGIVAIEAYNKTEAYISLNEGTTWITPTGIAESSGIVALL